MERILEIAKSAGLKARSETSLSPIEQKFAEAIINECLCLIDEENAMDIEKFLKMRDSIKEYFGIKQ